MLLFGTVQLVPDPWECGLLHRLLYAEKASTVNAASVHASRKCGCVSYDVLCNGCVLFVCNGYGVSAAMQVRASLTPTSCSGFFGLRRRLRRGGQRRPSTWRGPLAVEVWIIQVGDVAVASLPRRR